MSNHHQQQQFHQPQYVTVLGPNDVLLGRGSGPNDHEGNIQFRKYVAERKQDYMATNHRLTKTKIAREIVDLVACAGGRFLKKLEETPEQEVYEVVSDETVMEKAKQALRQNAGNKKDGIPHPPQQQKITATTSSSSIPLGVVDLEPIPFTDAGYSGPPPSQGDLSTVVWAQQQQAVAAAYQQQPQPAFDTFGGVDSGAAPTPLPYPYHQQQQQRQMPPPQMRMPSPQEQQQLYGYNSTSSGAHGGGGPPSIVSSEGTATTMTSSLSSNSTAPSRSRVNHRASLTIADLSHRNSTARSLDDMTDSFSKLSATGDSQNQNQQNNMSKMMTSTDTMGTIDYQESMTDMSINSSTFSFFKGTYGDSSSALDMPTPPSNPRNQFMLHSQQPHRIIAESTSSSPSKINRDSSSSSNKTRDSGDSMSFSDLLEKGGKSSSLSCNIGNLMDDIRRQVESEIGAPQQPQQQDVTNVESMRQSSLDVVKSLLPTESELLLEQQQQQQQQQLSQQDRQAYYRQQQQQQQGSPDQQSGGGEV